GDRLVETTTTSLSRMVACMLSPMTVVTYTLPRAICRSTLNGIWIGRFVRAGAGGMCGRRMRTVPSGSRSSVPRYSQLLMVIPFREGRWFARDSRCAGRDVDRFSQDTCSYLDRADFS